MEDLARRALPQGMTFEWSGLSREEIAAGGQAVIIFGLGLLLVYLTLAAQYESLALPFIILLSVPLAVLGALAGAGVARADQRRLLPDRAGDADRPVGEERHSDRRVRRAAARQRTRAWSTPRSRPPHPTAPDSDDVARVHPRRAAARVRHRRRPRRAQLGRHRGRRRHARVDVPQPDFHPGALRRRADGGEGRQEEREGQ